VLSGSTTIRFVTYVAVGAVTGYLPTLPFVLLVAGLETQTAPAEAPSLVNSVAERLIHALEPEDEVARIGHQDFAVLAPLERSDGARRLAAHLQRALAGSGVAVTLGWATSPRDGDNALSLYRAADERLYARRVITRNEDTSVAPLQRSGSPAVPR